MADGKVGGDPDLPFHLDQDQRSDSRDAIPFYFQRNLPVPAVVDADRRQQHARALIKRIPMSGLSPHEKWRLSVWSFMFAARLHGMPTHDRHFNRNCIPTMMQLSAYYTTEQAEPDKQHNFVQIWEERRAYERRYNVADAKRMPGYVWRVKDENGNAAAVNWNANPRMVVNMSVCKRPKKDLETFVFGTVHREIYKRRAKWFRP